MEKLREQRIAIEDTTQASKRPTGTYAINLEMPNTVELTRPDSTHREATVRARSLTRYYGSVILSGPIDVFDPPALD